MGNTNICEQFVSFDTAKMLKEAGFYEVCRCDYDGLNGFRWFRISKSVPKGWLPCPTQALAARWLREVHKLHVFAKRTYEYALDKFSWGYYIQNSDYEYCKNFEIGFDKYEQALEAGLQNAIKLIKK